MSDDGTTLLFNVTLKKGLESGDIQDTLKIIEDKWTSEIDQDRALQFEMTALPPYLLIQ